MVGSVLGRPHNILLSYNTFLNSAPFLLGIELPAGNTSSFLLLHAVFPALYWEGTLNNSGVHLAVPTLTLTLINILQFIFTFIKVTFLPSYTVYLSYLSIYSLLWTRKKAAIYWVFSSTDMHLKRHGGINSNGDLYRHFTCYFLNSGLLYILFLKYMYI